MPTPKVNISAGLSNLAPWVQPETGMTSERGGGLVNGFLALASLAMAILALGCPYAPIFDRIVVGFMGSAGFVLFSLLALCHRGCDTQEKPRGSAD